MTKKLTIEEVKKRAKDIGVWEVLDDVYINSKTKLNCKCIKKGHLHKVSWASFQKGRGCRYCNRGTVINNCKHTIDYIEKEFAKEGYILKTTKYEGAKQKLEYICSSSEKHEHSVSWDNWRNGDRCPYCANNAKLTIEFVRSEFEKEGYTLLTKVYKNNLQKLDYICPKGHKHATSWGNWRQGQRCPCYAHNIKLTIEFIREEFAKEGYRLLTKEYKDNIQKLDYICPKGHQCRITWKAWQREQRCPKCSNNISKWEKSVKSFIGKSNINYVSNDRTQLINPNTNRNLELDIWFPHINKAIECNGVYWHSKPDRKECDKIKQQLCKKQGIDLLVITDKEWNQNVDKCKAKIKNFVTGE